MFFSVRNVEMFQGGEPTICGHISGQIAIIIPKPELRGFWGSSLIKPPFRVTSADVVIICPDILIGFCFGGGGGDSPFIFPKVNPFIFPNGILGTIPGTTE